jgi:CRP/FNR family transcriptional regulator, nitrogen fixation regulation protein
MLTQPVNHVGPIEFSPLGQHRREASELMGASMIFRRNAEIYGEGEPANHLYKILSGTARTYKILSDGRRQVSGFHLTGDIFGLETGDAHSLSAEAVSRCKVLVVKRSALVALAGRQYEVAREVWQVIGQELHRIQSHSLLLIRTARERVAAFLLEMAERTSTGDVIEVPMSRQDIADYLGLTIETVSRTLTQLENLRAIELSSRHRIVLHNRSMLNRLNS